MSLNQANNSSLEVAAKRYWAALFGEGTEPTLMTVSRPHSSCGTTRQVLSEPISDSAVQLSRTWEAQTTLSLETLMLGSWALIQSRYSGADEVIFGCGLPDGTSFPLKVQTEPKQNVITWLEALNSQIEDSTQHVQHARGPIAERLYDTLCNFSALTATHGSARVPEEFLPSLVVGFNLGQTQALHASFDTSRFAEHTIGVILAQLAHTMAGLANCDDASNLEAVSVLRPVDLELMTTWQGPTIPYDITRTVTERVMHQAAVAPNAIALIENGTKVTYSQLMDRAEAVACELQRHGIGPEIPVGITIERSVDMVVALLGTLLTGAPYLPLDPRYPNARLRLMLNVAEAPIVLTVAESRASVPIVGGVKIIDIRDLPATVANPGRTCPATADNTMALTFTSGSTGEPKGVRIHHAGVLNRSEWQWAVYPLDADEVIPAKTTLSFVDHVWEIWGGLMIGHAVLLIDDDTATDGDALITVLAAHHVRRITLVPSLLDFLMDHAPDLGARLPQLVQWSASGEALAVATADRFSDVLPKATLINLYGMSEASPDATWAEVGPGLAEAPIGRPLHNLCILLLDHHDRPVPVGVPGQLHVTGVGLSPGYWKRPELTAERFVPNPFVRDSSDPHSRMYRSGDMARWEPDGVIQYLGRSDHQVKVRGVRIELGEVETVLAAHPAVDRAVVVGRTTKHGNQLVAYVVGAQDGVADLTGHSPIDPQSVRDFARNALPSAMVPSVVVVLSEFPLLPNGKVNHHELPEPVKALNSNAAGKIDAPLDPLQSAMLSLWRDVLEEPTLDLDDDFFDFGGHSLLAMHLASRIKQELGHDVGLAQLLRTGTARSFVESLTRSNPQDSVYQHVVPILDPDPELQNLFVIHGAGGNVLNLRPLGQELAGTFNLIGVQAGGLETDSELHVDKESMLTDYLAEIRSLQPSGPYILGGFSLGGVVAIELARHLRGLGEDVDAVVLLDVFHPTLEPRTIALREHFRSLVREGLSYARKVAAYRRADALERSSKDPAVLRQRAISQQMVKLWDYDDIGLVTERVLLLSATETANIWDQAPIHRGWADVTLNLKVVQVPGDHETQVSVENSPGLAEILTDELKLSSAQRSVLT